MSTRQHSFGEQHQLSVVDRFGTWLSRRRLRKVLGPFDGKIVADIGSGFDARFGMSVVAEAHQVIAVDVALNHELSRHPRVRCIEGHLPGALAEVADRSVDAVVLNSVLEHLDDPKATLIELRRILRNGGAIWVNVPSWSGKTALELSAFRFKLSPAAEIEDHRRYYSRRELWQAMRDADFMPSKLQVRYHKFGLNVFARALVHHDGEV